MTRSREESAERIRADIMQRADALVAIAKLEIIAADGGKAHAMTSLARILDEESDMCRTVMSRFISTLIVDRAIKELESGD